MNLEEIQKELVGSFDFDKALTILERLGEEFNKADLEEIANGLIKMLYQSREMDDVFFTSGYLMASRSYIEGSEVEYTLSFTFEISTGLTYKLEKPFFDEYSSQKEMLTNDLETLLELNKNEYELNENNDLAQANILRLEKVLLRLE